MSVEPLELHGQRLWLGAPHGRLDERGVALETEGVKTWGAFGGRIQPWTELRAIEVTACNVSARSTWRELASSALYLVSHGVLGDLSEPQLGVVLRGVGFADVRDEAAAANWQGELDQVSVAKAQQLCNHLIKHAAARELWGSESGRQSILQTFARSRDPRGLDAALTDLWRH